MSCKSFLYGSCTAIVLTTLCGGNVFAGFTDPGDSRQTPPTSAAIQNAVASADDDSAGQMLTFNAKSNDQTAGEQTELQSSTPTEQQPTKEPIAAPLPNALLSGGMLLAASFVATKILKRRLA